MLRQYYTLVAGLVELHLEGEHKRFDAVALRDEVAEGLSGRDLKALRLFYTFYDVENVVARLAGKHTHNVLGNYTAKELDVALNSVEPPRDEAEVTLPEWMARVVAAYRRKDGDKPQDDDIDTSKSLESALWEAFYRQCAASPVRFVRDWYAFDNTLRNVSAAYIARAGKLPVGEQLVGESDAVQMLAQSSAADFGLRGEIEYIESIIALLDIKNMLEKEQRFDQIRWAKADELAETDFFGIGTLLGYLAKANIIHRWANLDRKRGEEMLARLLDELSDRSVLDRTKEEERYKENDI